MLIVSVFRSVPGVPRAKMERLPRVIYCRVIPLNGLY